MNHRITSSTELQGFVLRMGFLPFSQNDIPAFSTEEHTPPQFWFFDNTDGS